MEKVFIELVHEHTSLMRVDLRHNKGKKGHRMGVIKVTDV